MSNKRKLKFKDAIKGKKPVLVDFYATWCGPCKQLSPIVASVKNDVAGKMTVIKVDVDKKQTISNKYKIKSLPTLAIFQNGKIVWRESGLKTKTQLLAVANHFIDNAPESASTSKAKSNSDAKGNDSVENKSDDTTSENNKGSWFSRLFK